jgi:hypothetical protein
MAEPKTPAKVVLTLAEFPQGTYRDQVVGAVEVGKTCEVPAEHAAYLTSTFPDCFVVKK